MPPLDVLYEDNHCLVVDKPAGVASAHFQGRDQTMDQAAKDYLRTKYHKKGNVYLGIVHRLDKPVSGALLFARTSKSAARLSEQFREGTIDKQYWAVVEGQITQPFGTIEEWLRKNEERGRVEIVEEGIAGARLSILHFQNRAGHDGLTWLEVRPHTGRTHQIRVQLAHHKHPIFGDAKYGSIHTFDRAIALHARSLTFMHPVRYEPITVQAELPRTWRGRFAYLFQEILHVRHRPRSGPHA